MKFIALFKRIGRKIKEFFIDEYGGNLIEYALLIAFALFIFFILVAEVTGLLEITFDRVNELPESIDN